MHVSDGTGRTKGVSRYHQRGQNNSIGDGGAGTVRSGADVSGHAGPPLPGPTVRTNTDSVLGVHFQVSDLHILHGRGWRPDVEELEGAKEEREDHWSRTQNGYGDQRHADTHKACLSVKLPLGKIEEEMLLNI